MTEKLSSAIDAAIQAANHKITNYVISGSLVVTGKAAQESSQPELRKLADVPITDLFHHSPSVADCAVYIGTAWILFQFGREIMRGIFWLCKKYKWGRK